MYGIGDVNQLTTVHHNSPHKTVIHATNTNSPLTQLKTRSPLTKTKEAKTIELELDLVGPCALTCV